MDERVVSSSGGTMPRQRPRVLCVLWHYPELSQTYVETELRTLEKFCDVRVVSLQEVGPDAVPYAERHDSEVAGSFERLRAIVGEFRPDVMHGHWLTVLPALHRVSRACGVPFTIRSHSFDTIESPAVRGWIADWHRRSPTALRDAGSDPLFLGVVAFPFSRPFLESRGIPADKIRDCRPVVDVDRFLDRSENGEDVMNVGACLAKKSMQDFLLLSRAVRSRTFRLYPIGYGRGVLERFAQVEGFPTEFSAHVEHRDMPAEYKRHAWMVYTASFDHRTIGWPMAVAEAQASGVGVILADVRPDLRNYLGGAGFLYSDLSEVPKLVAGPVPDETRELGFEVAKRADVKRHIALLTDLWPITHDVAPAWPRAGDREVASRPGP